MKIDWDKAKQIAAKRFEDVITACNKGDKDDLQCLMESGMALPEDYMIEDEPEKRYKYLDENNCFITDDGYVCTMIESTAPGGYEYYLPYLANKQDNKIVWTIVPYKVKSVPGKGNSTAILYTDELADAIRNATIEGMHPVTYEEVKASAMV